MGIISPVMFGRQSRMVNIMEVELQFYLFTNSHEPHKEEQLPVSLYVTSDVAVNLISRRGTSEEERDGSVVTRRKNWLQDHWK